MTIEELERDLRVLAEPRDEGNFENAFPTIFDDKG